MLFFLNNQGLMDYVEKYMINVYVFVYYVSINKKKSLSVCYN